MPAVKEFARNSKSQGGGTPSDGDDRMGEKIKAQKSP